MNGDRSKATIHGGRQSREMDDGGWNFSLTGGFPVAPARHLPPAAYRDFPHQTDNPIAPSLAAALFSQVPPTQETCHFIIRRVRCFSSRLLLCHCLLYRTVPADSRIPPRTPVCLASAPGHNALARSGLWAVEHCPPQCHLHEALGTQGAFHDDGSTPRPAFALLLGPVT